MIGLALIGTGLFVAYKLAIGGSGQLVAVIFFQCVMYFYQTAPLLLNESVGHSVEQPLFALFSFTFVQQSAGSSGLCVFPGMTAVQKLTLPLATLAMLLFWLILLALIKWGYHARQLGGK